MALILSGTNGITSVNGSAAAPSVTGTDTDTGIVYGTNTITLSTNGTAGLVQDASQNVGVGFTPSNWESGAKVIQLSTAGAGGTSGDAFAIWARGNTARFWNNAYYNGSNYVRLVDGVNPSTFTMFEDGSFYWGKVATGAASSTFSSGNITYNMLLNTNGGLQIYNTLGVGNTTPSTSGAGITFPATQSASTDANTLDDYEEGNWTPEIVGDSTNGTFTALYATGRYTKVGRVVNVFCIVGGTLSGAVGAAIVRGFPFNAAIGSQTLSINEQRYIDITGYTQMGFEMTSGASHGYLYMMGISKLESVINVSKLGSGGTGIVWIAGSYITA